MKLIHQKFHEWKWKTITPLLHHRSVILQSIYIIQYYISAINKSKTKYSFLVPQLQKQPRLSPRALPAFDFPVKKLPVTSSRLGPIFDFHCSLTKPPGMLLFKRADSSPQTTAAAKGETFPGQLYTFSITSHSQFLISHSGTRQMYLTDTENLPGIHLSHECKHYLFDLSEYVCRSWLWCSLMTLLHCSASIW